MDPTGRGGSDLRPVPAFLVASTTCANVLACLPRLKHGLAVVSIVRHLLLAYGEQVTQETSGITNEKL